MYLSYVIFCLLDVVWCEQSLQLWIIAPVVFRVLAMIRAGYCNLFHFSFSQSVGLKSHSLFAKNACRCTTLHQYHHVNDSHAGM